MRVFIELEVDAKEAAEVFKVVRAVSWQLEEIPTVRKFQMVLDKEGDNADD